MTILAMALVNDIEWNGSGTGFNAQVQAVGISAAPNQINFTIIVPNVPATILTSAFQGAISTAVKAKLASDYGITAGLFDTIGIVGATLAFL